MADKFSDNARVAKLTFLSDIFGWLNELNIEMQGKNCTMIDVGEKISSFKQKLVLWREKLSQGKIAAFPFVSEFFENSTKVTLEDLKFIFQDYLEKLQSKLDRYVPENVDLDKYSWVRNPFDVSVHEVGEDFYGFQEELIDFQANQVLKENFSQKCLTRFWAQLKDKPILVKEAEKALLPFPITYLCEAGFSTLVVIKNKCRNRLDPQNDVRCALSMNIYPSIVSC